MLTASRTALSVALMRSLHSRADPQALFDDPWGDRLVSETERDVMRTAALDAMNVGTRAEALLSPNDVVDAALRGSPAYASVVLRTRYAEDALQAAVGSGVRQYVSIGAGFDSFILRRPAFAADVSIIEIDHPATQSLKVRRINELGITLQASVHFVPADLSTETLASALSRSPFRADRSAFFSWLGVTMYLTHLANLATFRSIAACSLPGSELVFTYVDEHMLDPQSESFRKLQSRVSAMGEPFLCGFDPATLGVTLRECGLELIEDLDTTEAAMRYGKIDTLRPRRTRFSHMALARVMARLG